MNNKLMIVLAIGCAVLAAAIIGEGWYAHHARARLMEGGAAAAKPPALDWPTVDLTEQPEESFANLVERPLFIKGRRPVPEAARAGGAGGGAGGAQEGAAQTGAFDWQLVGVYSGPRQGVLLALVARDKTKVPKDNFRRLSEGQLLDGWFVDKISEDKMLLTQEGNEKVLPLRKPRPKPLLPAQAGQVPPAPPTQHPGTEPEPELPPPESDPEMEPISDEEFIDE